MDVMDKLTKAIDILNEVDEYASTLNDRLSVLDSKEQDLLHYIENNRINMLWCYFMIKEIKTIRVERRKVKNDMELVSRFNDIKTRITSKDNRRMIVAELHKKLKQLNATYKNRQYTEEDMMNVLRGKSNDEKNG
jgi:hypothetical protein